MPLRPSGFLVQLTPKLIQEAERRLSPEDARTVEPFLRQYYQQAAVEEFRNISTADLYGAALSHWQFGRFRADSQSLVRAYNPEFEKHGWQSTHTIVEIVTDDMPFLVDSASMVLNSNNMTIHHSLHPVFLQRRDSQHGVSETLEGGSDTDGMRESYMQFHVDRITDPIALEGLEAELEAALKDVRLAVEDWNPMHDILSQLATSIETAGDTGEEGADAAELLRWMINDHFTLLGYCEFHGTDSLELEVQASSVHGIFRGFCNDHEALVKRALPCAPERYVDIAPLLAVNKSNQRSTIHRPAYLDFVGVKLCREDTGKISIHCILGLFTNAAYNSSTREIPYLANKVRRLLAHSQLPRDGHLEKALQNVIETFPRDTLFQADESQLEPILDGILHLQERQHIRLFVANERFGRFHSALVYVPRERFHSDFRKQIGNILLEAYDGTSIEFDVHFSESILARIHFIVYSASPLDEKPDLDELRTQIEEASLSWSDRLQAALIEHFGEEQGLIRFSSYRNAFSGGYQDDFSPRRAAYDIQRIEESARDQSLGIYFYRPVDNMDISVRLRLYSREDEVSLSEVLPVIENMGLRVLSEKPYVVRVTNGTNIWIHEFKLVERNREMIDVDRSRGRFELAFSRIWAGEAENDGFNRLVLGAGLDWRECVLLRAYARYLRQIRIRYSQDYIIETLTGNPHMTRRLVDFFHSWLKPDTGTDESALAAVREGLKQGLTRVQNLDEDRILSAFVNLIEATLRTNFYQPDGAGRNKDHVSFKLDPTRILRMPEPRPMFEIFVYSPRVEAVHLRGGPIARGGLRWSDRPEDFRTEVLGLVKAQMVKNAVIVPVGSKGGFVVKRLPEGDHDQQMKEVVECYQTFIRGMLDITDNISVDGVVHPERVRRHDGDDPYLVVAADKGTATFSDIANGVAAEYGYWLGDAFASGGSVGYDHKAMGITARGAWESVKRHFRELGIDCQNQEFNVIGIGDMAGDVFGNGMLLSETIRLVGAFNHRHIFIDPDPDPATSFSERKRLFELPGSAWSDYDHSLISAGGGVFARSQKSISLSEEARAALGINSEQLTPGELIHAMLKAPVDLIWNGGIGTYVKASSESHEQVRDRANDNLRVSGSELRCKIFGEGGNLGMTQLSRIEFNEKGGLCYTDAIDNSAGVDTSDHEVNIKILLDRAVAAGDLTSKQRNEILASMTDLVGELVLRDNYGQTQAISLAAGQAPGLLRQHMRFIRDLEKQGNLSRSLEFLPLDEAASERLLKGQGLMRAELSVILAYSKLRLNARLIDSDVPEDPFLGARLKEYFPAVLGERFATLMNDHPLKREIIVTHIVNDMVNRAGLTFAYRLRELIGARESHIARAFAVSVEVFQLRNIWAGIEQLDNVVGDDVQRHMLMEVSGLLERVSSWLVRFRPESMNIRETVEYFQPGVIALLDSFPRTLGSSHRLQQKKTQRKLVNAGVPGELATRVSYSTSLSSALDIVDVAQTLDEEVARAAAIYFAIGDVLGLHWLRDQVHGLAVRNHWQAMAAFSLRNSIHQQQKELTSLVLTTQKHATGRKMLNHWIAENKQASHDFLILVEDFKAAREIDFAMLSVAISRLEALRNPMLQAAHPS